MYKRLQNQKLHNRYQYYTDIGNNLSSQKQRRSKSVAVDWTAVGRRIRELRGFEMIQQEFADRIEISQKYVSDMELGKVEVGAEILLRIALEFGRTIEWLLTGEDRPGPLGKK